MEYSTEPFALDELKENETLSYFATLMDDERIDQFFEKGERRADFDFIGTSCLAVHPLLLPKNHLTDDNREITAFAARGHFLLNDTHPYFNVTLSSIQGVEPRTLVMENDPTGNIFLHENNTAVLTDLSLKEFGDISFRCSGMQPDQIRRDLNLPPQEALLKNAVEAHTYWSGLTQANAGVYTTTAITRQTIAESDDNLIELRMAQKEKELPRSSIRELVIEHASQLQTLDAEVIHRLELQYESTENHNQGMTAEKRVVSGCERQLINARLVSKDRHGRITPLDIYDATLMRQFQTLVEMALQTT